MVWYEDGRRRDCQDRTEAGLAARLEKVAVCLAAEAPGLEKPGADLIAYYCPRTGSQPGGRGHASTPIRSASCASVT